MKCNELVDFYDDFDMIFRCRRGEGDDDGRDSVSLFDSLVLPDDGLLPQQSGVVFAHVGLPVGQRLQSNVPVQSSQSLSAAAAQGTDLKT